MKVAMAKRDPELERRIAPLLCRLSRAAKEELRKFTANPNQSHEGDKA